MRLIKEPKRITDPRRKAERKVERSRARLD